MSSEEKIKLIEKIKESNDSVLLTQLSRLMDISTFDETYELSEEQVKAVEIAESQIKYGDTLSHEDAKKETGKWFGE